MISRIKLEVTMLCSLFKIEFIYDTSINYHLKNCTF